MRFLLTQKGRIEKRSLNPSFFRLAMTTLIYLCSYSLKVRIAPLDQLTSVGLARMAPKSGRDNMVVRTRVVTILLSVFMIDSPGVVGWNGTLAIRFI